jgi:arsenate reductase
MAAALLAARSAGAREASSAGVEPSGEIDPAAVAAMREVGLDVSEVSPRRWSPIELATSRVIWLGAQVPPELEGHTVEHWDLGQPAGGPVEAARELRRELERRIDLLQTRWSR